MADSRPLRSRSRSNETACPPSSRSIPARSRAVTWTKTSFDPPPGAIKPKPLVENHFTVPVVIVMFLSWVPPAKCDGPAKLKI